jgi:tubulin monoglycylase TTLL3/8
VVVSGSEAKAAALPYDKQLGNAVPASVEDRVGYVRQLLVRLAKKYPQTSINGDSNIWIVKPARLSRGRGIKLFDNFPDIYGYTKARDPNWVVQKYMENPLLYQGRKLDLRQWVIVTDWNPLTIWFYQECYIRLSTSPYDLTNIANRFSHLTNNSVNKNAKNFEAEASFLSQEAFAEYLKTCPAAASANPFYDSIQPKMKEIVVKTFLCVQDMVENRKNSAEMYGYDFCIDDNLNVWLIEVNASPAWDYSSVICCDSRP